MKTKKILIVTMLGLGLAYFLYKKFNKSIKLEEELTDLSTLKQKKLKLTLDEKIELFKKANTFAGIDFFGDEQARAKNVILLESLRAIRLSARKIIVQKGLEQEFADYVKANPEQREGLPVPMDEGTIGNIEIGRGGL
jgi:hypothetical protein|tara:strand:- start:1240 stop:1653 length:414 start_codon:yes stop_codon:yes gene_type:complete